MKTNVTGQAAATTAAPTQNQLAALRAAIEGLLATSSVITDLEYQTAAQRVHACQSVETLQKWFRNCIREVARREEAEPEMAVVPCATAEQTQEVHKLANHVAITRAEKATALAQLPTLDEATAKALVGALWAKIVSRTGGPRPPVARPHAPVLAPIVRLAA